MCAHNQTDTIGQINLYEQKNNHGNGFLWLVYFTYDCSVDVTATKLLTFYVSLRWIEIKSIHKSTIDSMLLIFFFFHITITHSIIP